MTGHAFRRAIARCALAAILAAGSGAAEAKSRAARWDDGLCSYSMRYDDQNIDPELLANTIELLKSESAAVPIAISPDTPDKVATLDPGAFESRCAATAARLRAIPILPLPDLAEFRRDRVAAVEDACRYGAISLRGLKDPAAFRDYAPAASCNGYVDALEGKSDLAAAWRALIDRQCASNADPRACRATFETTARVGPGDAGMRLTLGTFGWNNCATAFTRFNGREAERLAERGRIIGEAFNRRFKVKESCDAP